MHGDEARTTTIWFNRHFPGQVLTAEFGAHPSTALLRGTVATRVLRIFDAHR